MGKKYIIELEEPEIFDEQKFYQCTQMPWLAVSENVVENLTPYTEPDLEQVRKEGYKDGYDAGFGRKIDASYQEGLSDAWEAARTLWNTPNRKEIFGHTTFNTVLTTLTAQKTIEKIRQYEQSQKEKPIRAEDVMRQYLDEFCKRRWCCAECVLRTDDFTCGRGYSFTGITSVSDEEVRRAYAEVMKK